MKSLTLIKIGALGDIVRTSYLVNALKIKFNYHITWITDKSAFDLLKNNPNIDELIESNSEMPSETDLLLCLEDQYEYVNLGSKIKSKKIIGSYIDNNNLISYTQDCNEWFDMSLISKNGIDEADILKKNNKLSFNKIFSKILNLELADIKAKIYTDKEKDEKYLAKKNKSIKLIGLNLFAGKRWPSKEITADTANNLVLSISKYLDSENLNHRFILFCDNSNLDKVDNIVSLNKNILMKNTGASVLDFSALIKSCDYIITTDSLGMHLAIANNINHLSFFSPTSAEEIDTFGYGIKVSSTSDDYCTYKAHTDNSSLSYNRLFEFWLKHTKNIGWYIK